MSMGLQAKRESALSYNAGLSYSERNIRRKLRWPNTHPRKKGSLFSNATKEKETQPDYTEKVLLDGKTYRLAGRKSATGKNYLSLSLSEPNPGKKIRREFGAG